MSKRDGRGALRVLAAAGAALLIPNALVAILTDGWWVTYRFHLQRSFDLGSVWALILPYSTPTSLVNLTANLALALGGAALLVIGWRRREADGGYPVLAVGSALLALLMLTSKIASPQQALWLLPSLALLSTRLGWWLAWNGWAVLVFAISFGVGLLGYDASMAPFGDGLGAVLRTVLLIALIFVFMTARPKALSPRMAENRELSASPTT